MALAVEASDGARKLTIEARTIAGADIDLTDLQIRPILRQYTIFAILRLTTAAGDTTDLEITWQAVPKLPDTQNIGTVVGIGAAGAGGV